MKIKKTKFKNKISLKLLKFALLAACFLGLIASFIQIMIDAYYTSQSIDSEALQMLSMIEKPALTSVTEGNKHSAQEILKGLIKLPFVQQASLETNSGVVLSYFDRPLAHSHYRLLSDHVLGVTRPYQLFLYLNPEKKQYDGKLLISVDTIYYGRKLIQRSFVIVLSGLVRAISMALLLYFIYSLVLAKPLGKLRLDLEKINLESIGYKLRIPKGHEENELGFFIFKINKLLDIIDNHLQLRKQAEEQILQLSRYDYVTRLPNRHTFQSHLHNVLMTSETGNKAKVAVLCLGIDDFSSLHVQYNFSITELILIKVADRLRDVVGSYQGYIGRLAEDQFAIMIANVSDVNKVAEFAQTILNQLSVAFDSPDGESISLMATIGISLYPEDGVVVDILIQQAEFAMITAKTRRTDRYQFYVATLDTQIRQRKKIEMDLHNALKKNQLFLHFQPQVDLENNKIVGVEALIRWQHPELGFISPEIFIPMAEKNQDITLIGNWVLDSACYQLKYLQQQGFNDIVMAVNLSAIQVQDERIIQQVQETLAKYQLDAKFLELEVTETSIIENLNASVKQLERLKDLGLTLALDDFGTGYSSLSYLKKFPFDKIKIDKSFIEELPENVENRVIVDAIVQLGHNFGLTVLAEGIEYKQQVDYLMKIDCKVGQGYFYSRPVASSHLLHLLTKGFTQEDKGIN